MQVLRTTIKLRPGLNPFGKGWWSGVVMSQDIAVLTGLQRGLRQPGFTHLVLSAEERRIINMHRNLERYLGIDPSDMTGGPAAD